MGISYHSNTNTGLPLWDRLKASVKSDNCAKFENCHIKQTKSRDEFRNVKFIKISAHHLTYGASLITHCLQYRANRRVDIYIIILRMCAHCHNH